MKLTVDEYMRLNDMETEISDLIYYAEMYGDTEGVKYLRKASKALLEVIMYYGNQQARKEA